MGRGVASASLRVWAPQGAQVLFVRQVSPTVEDLTARRQVVNPLTGAYPTGSWGDESRDYHVAVRLSAKGVGQEQLAARVQLAVGDEVVAQGLVKAMWSSDDTLTTRINPAVAHYTGQAELAAAIQDGLAAKAAGDDARPRRSSGGRSSWPPRPATTRRPHGCARSWTSRTPSTGTVRLQAQDRQAGRDGARHRLDQDHPGQEVSAMTTTPAPTGTTPRPTTTATPAARRSLPPAPAVRTPALPRLRPRRPGPPPARRPTRHRPRAR